jgi:hypothetical protein
MEIKNERGSRVITLIHREEEEIVSLLGIPFTRYIDIDAAEAILRLIRRTPPEKPIDFILHTPGGASHSRWDSHFKSEARKHLRTDGPISSERIGATFGKLCAISGE